MPLTRIGYPYANFTVLDVKGNAVFNEGLTVASQFIIDRIGGSTPNFIMQGPGEQTFRFYNTNTTGSTRTSWKMASRLNPDWSFIWYTDLTDNGSDNLTLAKIGFNPLMFFDSVGNIGIKTNAPTAALQVNSSSISNISLILRGFVGQTADIEQIQNSAGSVLAYHRNDGYYYNTNGMGAGGFVHSGVFVANAQISSNVTNVNNVGILVRGIASQVADLQQWQNSTPTTLAKIDNAGNFTVQNDNARIRAVRSTATAQTTGLGADSGTGWVGSESNTSFSILTNNISRLTFAADGSTATFTGGVIVGGNLTVNGTTTTVNSSTLTIDDKNIEMGVVPSATVSTTGTVGSISGTGPWTATITGMSSTTGLIVGSAIAATNGTGSLGAGGTYIVASIVSSTSVTYTATGGTTPVAGTVTNITTTGATDTTANGGGIVLKGATDKSILWDSTNSNWTSNQPFNITTGNPYRINNVNVLSATALGSTVTSSSLTSFGTSPTLTTPTIDTINVSGAAIAAALWNTTLTTGSISMGGSLTSGSVNIANGSSFIGTVSIGSGASNNNKIINIGTSASAGTTQINLGSSGGATTQVSILGPASANANPGLQINGQSGLIGFYNALSAGNYNPNVATNDKAIIFHNGTVDTGSFIIAPWSNTSSGIKITNALVSTPSPFTSGGAVTTGGALNLNYASPAIASNNASAASIFTATVTGVTIGSSTIKTTVYPAEPSGTTSGTVTQSAQLSGTKGMPINARGAAGVALAYTLAASDAGKMIYVSSTPTTPTITIPANSAVAFEIGTTIVVMNDIGAATNVSIAITTDTLQLVSTGATGTRTLARYGMATLVKVTATKWIITGNGVT